MVICRRTGANAVNNPLLILTKTMRGTDPKDLSDIKFLLKHESVKEKELRAAFR